MISTAIMLFISIVISIESVLGSSLETKPCPPGYIIYGNGFCEPETISGIPELASMQESENGSKLEKVSPSLSQTQCPGFQIDLLSRDLKSKFGQQCGYNFVVQLTDWTSSTAVINLETANGYQDSVSLNEGLPGPVYHTFRILANQGDLVNVCTDPEGSLGPCTTYKTNGIDSVVFVE
ncbi:MAG: hypothetical protein ACRD8W_25825 [Nitrososphaeraceae archaeon]